MVYISLTTVPLRLNNWHIAERNLRSLCEQVTDSTFDYKVVLNIPVVYKAKNEDFLLPSGLFSFKEEFKDRLIINREDPDYGPILKIVGAFKYAKKDDYILAVDDDHQYHPEMLITQLKYNEKRVHTIYASKDIVQCYRGDVPVEKRAWMEGFIMKYMLKPTHFYFPVLQERQLLIPGHWHGVLYKRWMFGKDFMDILDKGDNDDILVGYYMKKKGIDIMCIPYHGEDDGRPVNDSGRPCYSFPIVENLPTEDSGFNEFRRKADSGYGRTDEELMNYLQNHDIIFEK
jgi:hypothetical protein